MVDASLAYEILMYLNSFYFGKWWLNGSPFLESHTTPKNYHVPTFREYIFSFILIGLLAFVELGVFIYKSSKWIPLCK